MPDLDRRFADLRADIVAGVAAGPDVPELAHRARRRAQRRVASAAVAAAVAVGGVLVAWPDPDPAAPVVTRPDATPTRLNASPAPTVPLDKLIYGSAAAKPEKPGNRERWSVDKDHTGPLEVPGCPEEPALTDGTRVAHTVGRYRVPADGSDYRREQLLLSDDEAKARTQLASLVASARNCRSNAKATYQVERLNIGDEAWLLSEQRDDGEFDPSTTRSVVVRQGRAIAIYFDRYGPESGRNLPPMVTVERHKSDARAMVTRLCRLGFGC